ncbi:MAG: thioesterase family protein [Pseudomonadota bacterium]
MQSHYTVLPEWVDYNGHMRDAYYGVIASAAIDHLMDQFGMDDAYRSANGNTLYTVETHTHFINEVKLGAELSVETCIVEFDTKRLHLWQKIQHNDMILCAQETMLLHVHQGETVQVAPFDAVIAQALADIQTSQGMLEIEARLRARAIACPTPKGKSDAR